MRSKREGKPSPKTPECIHTLHWTGIQYIGADGLRLYYCCQCGSKRLYAHRLAPITPHTNCGSYTKDSAPEPIKNRLNKKK